MSALRHAEKKLDRMIAAKEAECEELKSQLQEWDERIKGTQASLERLVLECEEIPDFQDLDYAIDMVRGHLRVR